MSIYCKRVFRKTFEHSVSKQAYLNACKWLAQNIYGNVELSKHVVVSIEKQQGKSPAFIVSVYTKEEEGEIRESFCKHCKTLHTIFYSINGMNCNECKANAFFKDLDEQLQGKAKFVKQVLEDKQNE